MEKGVYPARYTEFFGPCLWKSMHSIAFTFAADPHNPTPEEQKAAVDFFGSLKTLIPCGACAMHYGKYLEVKPVDTSSRDSLARWVYDLHSNVNERRHVPNPSFEQVEHDYTGMVIDQQEMKNMSAAEVQEKVVELADPHFGKMPSIGKKELLSASGMNMTTLLVVFGVGALIAAGIYSYGNRKSEEKQKK